MTDAPAPTPDITALVRELRGLIEKATPGDWPVAQARTLLHIGPFSISVSPPRVPERDIRERVVQQARDDATFVSAAKRNLPQLLAAYEAVVRERDEALANLCPWCQPADRRVAPEPATAAETALAEAVRERDEQKRQVSGWKDEIFQYHGRMVDAETALAEKAAEVERLRGRFDMLAHLRRQREWSERTFGPGSRAKGVVAHIRKELAEIEADPGDIEEWIDVAILTLDGAWRSGASPEQIVEALVAKQTKNEGRVWPDWRTMSPDQAIEHDRSADAARALSATGGE
jgi:hypothetical protein